MFSIYARLALHSGRATAFGLAALAFGAAGLASAPAAAEVKNGAKFGAWETHCETPPGSQAAQCAIVQTVIDADRPNLTLVIIALKTADRKSRLLRIVAPLGVLLPPGVGLRIDDEDYGRINFIRCQTNGCVAEVFIDDKLLPKLEAGTAARLVVYQTLEEGVGVPLSLSGFKDGFGALP
jgi:invasion protein IalB